MKSSELQSKETQQLFKHSLMKLQQLNANASIFLHYCDRAAVSCRSDIITLSLQVMLSYTSPIQDTGLTLVMLTDT